LHITRAGSVSVPAVSVLVASISWCSVSCVTSFDRVLTRFDAIDITTDLFSEFGSRSVALGKFFVESSYLGMKLRRVSLFGLQKPDGLDTKLFILVAQNYYIFLKRTIVADCRFQLSISILFLPQPRFDASNMFL